MATHEQDFDNRESNPNASGPDRLAGSMGVSSEREGETGPGQRGTDGERVTEKPARETGNDPDTPPEQAPGNEETNPVGIQPKPHHPKHNPGHSGA